MTTKILWIIDGYTYWDKTYGNTYYLTRITHTGTGKSLFIAEGPGNSHDHILNAVKRAYGRIHAGTYESIGYRDFNRKLKSEYYAPVERYIRVNGRTIDTLAKQIRQLRSKS